MLDLGRTFLQSVERSPHAPAVVDGDERLTYTEWYERIQRTAAGLAALGLGRGDHLLIVLQNRIEMATLHWACQFLGVIATPLNWRAKPEEVEYCATDSQAKAIVFEAVSADAVAGSPVAQSLPRIAVGGAAGGTLGFADLAMEAPASPILQAASDDISLMLYTSGTTGKPKGVPRRHRTERAAALGHVAQNLYRRGERTLGVMPLYHTMGVRSLLAMALIDGLFVCVPKFDCAAAFGYIGQERVTNLYLVPTLYHDMLAWREKQLAAGKTVDISSVTKLGFAGAPMPDGLLKRLTETFRPELFVNHYGSSEVYTFAIDQDATRKAGSAGRAGINTRIRVVPLAAETPEGRVAPGEEGQIICDLQGDEAFEGYWNRPDADAKSIRGGWYFTGDTGYIDADGDLFVTGRVDDMIISGGENISPVDIESVLSLHPSVDEVAVAGLRDERWGQKVVAFVKTRGEVSPDALNEYCQHSDLLNFKRPREYVFVREIPKSPVGKILRRKLVAGEYEVLPATGEGQQNQQQNAGNQKEESIQ
ncbi:AMP-binding protein [Massilia sp.]|uniref:AMP-binding protein n=1 Tax=Massilia sp. TaxID=1882437 RepID=UPI00289E0B47|nr:AMP-binding protein [Massilia sp.]